jgi:hypothetical protein
LRESVSWELSHALRLAMRVSLVNLIFMGVFLLLCPTTAQAQDPFEIHIYEYEELPPGGFTLEGHFNSSVSARIHLLGRLLRLITSFI